jgi:RNA polymerase sigma-70 factor (ECF subfamily)
MSPDSAEPDRLLHSACNGDESALAALFDLYRERLERMVKIRLDRRLQRRVDPADVVQETWVAVQRKFPKYAADSELPFFLWIRLETGQKLIDMHRMHLGTKMRDAGQEISLHRGGLPSVASITLAEQLLGRFSTASQAAMRAELKIKVQDALNGMDEHDREMLVLRHFEELTNSEAALALGISPTAACNRYVRALQRLKRVFEDMPGGIEGVWS